MIFVTEKPVEELNYPIDSDEQWKQLTLLVKRNIKSESIRIEVIRKDCVTSAMFQWLRPWCNVLFFKVTNVDKPDRGALHKNILTRYAGKLYSNTIQDCQKKFVVVSTKKDFDSKRPKFFFSFAVAPFALKKRLFFRTKSLDVA